MSSLIEVLQNPQAKFIGVVEMESSYIVGVLDDPMGVALTEVRLGYPLEFLLRAKDDKTELGFIIPECGLPDEVVLDASSVAIHVGGSTFGQVYFSALKSLGNARPIVYSGSLIKRPQRGNGGT